MLKLKNISKVYSSKGGVTHRALNNVSLSFDEKGLVFILGKSGCGKSTLLNIIGGLDTPTRGSVELYGNSLKNFNALKYDYYRNTFIGFVFQEFNLIEQLNVYENVMLALDLKSEDDDGRVDEILRQTETYELKDRKVFEISGGQKQRVAIARSLVKDPSVILADEPTGSLDSATSAEIMKLLKKLSEERLVIVISHNREMCYEYGDRIIEIKDGEILKDFTNQIQENDNRSSFIGNEIIKVPKDGYISERNLKHLNELLDNEPTDHYLIVEKNPQKVKAMFPHLMEAISSYDEAEENKYVPYEEKESEEKELKIVKSNLPLKRGLAFGFKNLKVHVVKLVFSIILLGLALTLQGASTNFKNYNQNLAIAEMIKANDYKEIKVVKDGSNYESGSINNDKFSNYDSKLCASLAKETISDYEFDRQFVYKGNSPYVVNRFLDTYSLATDFDNIPEKVIYKSSNPKSSNSVYISELLAREIAKALDIKTKDVIDKDLKIQSAKDVNLKIYGIYDVGDLSKYDSIFKEDELTTQENRAYEEYHELYNSKFKRIYVPVEFQDFYFDNLLDERTYYCDINLNSSNIDRKYSFSIKPDTLLNHKVDLFSYENGVCMSKIFIETIYSSYKGMISEPFDNIPIETKIKELNSVDFDVLVNDNVNYIYIFEDLKINSYTEQEAYALFISNDVLREVFEKICLPSAITLIVDGMKKSEILNIINVLEQNRLEISSNEIYDFLSIYELIIILLKSLIKMFNLIIYVITIILLYSFINSTVKDNTRQIGILRGIGASVLDIFKIYILEALIIVAASLIVAILGYSLSVLIINNIGKIYYPILTFDIRIFLSMIFSGVVVSAIALILPIRNIVRLDPIKAINNSI